MKIEIQNNVQNIKIDVKKNEEGSFAILISEEKVEERVEGRTLGSAKPGDIVTIGGRIKNCRCRLLLKRRFCFGC